MKIPAIQPFKVQNLQQPQHRKPNGLTITNSPLPAGKDSFNPRFGQSDDPAGEPDDEAKLRGLKVDRIMAQSEANAGDKLKQGLLAKLQGDMTTAVTLFREGLAYYLKRPEELRAEPDKHAFVLLVTSLVIDWLKEHQPEDVATYEQAFSELLGNGDGPVDTLFNPSPPEF